MISAAMLTSSSKSASVKATCGTNSSRSSAADRIVRSTSSVYVNVPMNVPMNAPSTAWLTRSATKLPSTRGVNWLLASCSAAMVTEKTTPVTVIRLPAMALSMLRGPAAPPPNGQRRASLLVESGVGICTATIASTVTTTTATLGTNRRLSRTRSQARCSGEERLDAFVLARGDGAALRRGVPASAWRR